MVQCLSIFFFFKQKTAYDVRISDWSSDVCSSDLSAGARQEMLLPEARRGLVREARPPCRHRRKGRQRRTLSVRREWRRAGPVRADGDDRVPRLGVVGGDAGTARSRSEENTSEPK